MPKSLTTARIALSRHRTLCRGPWFRFDQDLRHRGVVAGTKCILGSFELFEFHGLPGAAYESAIQGRERGEPVLPYPERFGAGLAAIIRGAARKWSTERWLGPTSGQIAAVLRGRED